MDTLYFLRDGHYYKQLKLESNVKFRPVITGEEVGVREDKEMTQCHTVIIEQMDTSVFCICLSYDSQTFIFNVFLKNLHLHNNLEDICGFLCKHVNCNENAIQTGN